MSNSFSKEERVAFDQLLAGFEDALVMTRQVGRFRNNDTDMERSGDVVWRPMPYIANSRDGMDQTGNFGKITQLSVPATLGYEKSVPWVMDAKELRDALQEERFGVAARDRIASDINQAILTKASNQATLVVKRTGAAGASNGFDDVAECESIMNEAGIPSSDRTLVLSTRDYNGLAGDLAGRQNITNMSKTAYERAYVGMIASFDTFKLDGHKTCPAAAGSSITIDTRASASNYHVPVATRTAATGERANVDNRYQTITVSSTTNVVAGDSFTVAGINAVHHITKEDTGQLKTFRVISVDSSTTMTVSPPLITNQGGSDAEEQYQNCTADSTASNAAITFLNVAAKPYNVFWHRDAIELMPGRYAVPTGSGAEVLRATSAESGIEITMTKQLDVNTLKTSYRVDCLFGVTVCNPEMAGVILFNQT